MGYSCLSNVCFSHKHRVAPAPYKTVIVAMPGCHLEISFLHTPESALSLFISHILPFVGFSALFDGVYSLKEIPLKRFMRDQCYKSLNI